MDDEAQFSPGQKVGSYEIVRLLGTGAFGAVYEVLRLPLRRRAALKILHAEHLRHREVVQRFLREAEVVAQLEHPNIVSVYDVGEHQGAPFLAMEYLDGEPLASRMERVGAIEPYEAVDLLIPVMAALSAVHDRGIVHRDLKPDNVFLVKLPSGGLQPKLLDFGIAKVREAEQALTRTNAMMGTPHYMSPEQAQESKHIDAASDQWSLGVILFECLCGSRPFRGESLLALLSAIAGKPTPDPRSLAPSVAPDLAAAVMRSLAKNPTDRWASVRALGAALLPFAGAPVQAQWTAYFYGEGAFDTTHGGGAPGPMRLSGIPSVVPQPGTLQPTTRSLVEAGVRRPKRTRAFVFGAVGVGTLAVGGALAAALIQPPRTTPTAPVHAAAAVVATVVPTPIARPASSRSAHAHAPAEAVREAPPMAPTVAPVAVVVVPGAPAPPGVAPVAVTIVDDPAESTHGRHRGRHRAPRSPTAAPSRTPAMPAAAAPAHPPPARTDCANGICTVD